MKTVFSEISGKSRVDGGEASRFHLGLTSFFSDLLLIAFKPASFYTMAYRRSHGKERLCMASGMSE